MSGWDRIAGATNGRGSGAIAFRLVIGGLPAQAVSDARMESLAGTPPRYRGLSMSGFKISEQVDPLRATISAKGFTAVFVDDQSTMRWASQFASKPTRVTYLNADLTGGETTTITALDSSLFATSGYVWIGAEAIAYASKASSTAFTTLTRGSLGTSAAAHYTGNGRDLRFPEITNRPRTLIGQRASVYAYGAGDSPTGDGTLIWRGVVAGDPAYEGGAWSLLIDPITSLLDQELGADLAEPIAPRGIYLPSVGVEGSVLGVAVQSRFRLNLIESSSTTPPVPIGGVTIEIPETGSSEYFWETQEEFVEYLNTLIASATSSFQSTIRAVSDGPDGYHFQVRTGATARYVTIGNAGYIGPTEPVFEPSLVTVDGAPVDAVTTNADYYLRASGRQDIPGAGTVPRGFFRAISGGEVPLNRIYLGGAVGLTSTITAALITWQDPEGDRSYSISSIESSTRSVLLSRDYTSGPTGDAPVGWPASVRIYTREQLPEIRLGRRLATGSVGDLVNTVANASATQVNQGALPDLRLTDVELGSWLSLSYDDQPSMVRDRRYWSWTPRELKELLSEELKLAGYYPYITSTGTIGVRRLELAPPTRQGTRTPTVLSGGEAGFPTYERSSFGKHNTTRLHTGYSFTEDDHEGPPIVFRDVGSFSQSPMARVLEIRPYSEYAGGIEPYDEVVALGARVSGVFGGPYQTVVIAVPLKDFSVVVGDTVFLTTRHVPDSDGTMGVSERPAIVIARQWEPRASVGRLTLLLTDLNIAGYSPEAVVSSQSNTSGNTWAITVGTTEFPASPFNTADMWFEAGDLVRVWELDDATSTLVSGTVVSASGNVVTVTFGSTWTPGSSTWVLAYDLSSTPWQASQDKYASVASSVGLRDLATDAPAQEFSP